MRPYGQSGGCSEEPAEFHRCALDKAKAFNPPRTPDGTPEVTIADPSVYTRPWTMALGWRRDTVSGYEVWENACWEGVSQRDQVNPDLKPYPGAFQMKKFERRLELD